MTHQSAETELLADFVERWAASRPEDTAVSCGDSAYTWAQWADRIRRVAGGLSAAGIRRGDRVAFLDKNHPACLEVTFAAASIGAATVILNWRLTTDELTYCLRDSDARVLFVGAELASVAVGAREAVPGVKRLVVVGGREDDYERLLANIAPATRSAEVESGDTALIIYSSGTTGRPKGVLLSQQALVAHTVNVGTKFPFAEGDKNLVAMPLFHVGGVCYAFFGIRAGVPSIMTREPDAASLAAALVSGATHAFFVPPVIAGFLAAGEQARVAMARLKYLGYGAAPMPLPLLQQALDAWPDTNFVQVYGQTEVSGVATTLDPDDHRDAARSHLLLSAGTAVPGMEVRVVDPTTGEDVVVGEQGEIWFRSAQVMTGYLNAPSAAAATITPEGWLRTGDIGRLDDEGYVYVEDRIKDMIITGGENVYGPEVERVLMAHPAVTDAAVIGVPDEHWGESVKAIISTCSAVTADEIIGFCRDSLAGYKCPRTVDFVDALPRNPSGKILKRELRAPYWEARDRVI